MIVLVILEVFNFILNYYFIILKEIQFQNNKEIIAFTDLVFMTALKKVSFMYSFFCRIILLQLFKNVGCYD
jgi:hypothetical protein